MTNESFRLRNFVGGTCTSSMGGKSAEVLNPANECVLGEVPSSGVTEVDEAVQSARQGFKTWRETTPAERSLMLLNFASRIEEHAIRLATVESLNVGKPLAMASAEVAIAVDNLRFFAGAARILEGRSAGEYLRGYTSMVRREPIGVIGQIVPWNYPLMMAVWKFAPALAAGNTVVLKPSELTPLTALMVAELSADIFPPGVLNVIAGNGDPVGSTMSAHPDVDMVTLTGSSRSGRHVASSASGSLKRVHLELGGKAPAIVFDDADLECVAETIKIMGFWNAGQECGTPCRILASSRIFDRLIELLVPKIQSIRMGDPELDPDVAMGPVISRLQQERILGFLERADRATVLTGGRDTPDRGFFVQPTLLTDVNQHDEIVQNEVFGPVITIQKFQEDAQAIDWANDVPYGLAASVWTNHVGKAHEAIRKLNFGSVWVNDHLPFVSEMPWGGFKQSGYGKDLSTYSLEDYTQIKHAMVKFC